MHLSGPIKSRNLLISILAFFISFSVLLEARVYYEEYETIKGNKSNLSQSFTVEVFKIWWMNEIFSRQPFFYEISSFNGTSVAEPSFCFLQPPRYEIDDTLYNKFPFPYEWNLVNDYKIHLLHDFLLVFTPSRFAFYLHSLLPESPFTGWITLVPELQEQFNSKNLKVFSAYNPKNKTIYLLDNQNIFFKPLKSEGDISQRAIESFSYDNITAAEYHLQKVYIVADNIIDIYMINDDRTISPLYRLDAAFFGETEISPIAINFEGKYAYVLDPVKGVFVIDIYLERTNNSGNISNVFQHRKDLFIAHKGAKSIEITDYRLFIASNTLSQLAEYFINRDPSSDYYYPEILNFTFHRNYFVEGEDKKVKKIMATDRLLCIITFDDKYMVFMHSIPLNIINNNGKLKPILTYSGRIFTVATLHSDFIYFTDSINGTAVRPKALEKAILQYGYYKGYTPVLSFSNAQYSPLALNCTVSNVSGCTYAYQLTGISTGCYDMTHDSSGFP